MNKDNKKKIDIIDNILLFLGNKIILPNESLIFYHSSVVKFEKLNNIGNWFSPIRIKEKSNYYLKYNIYAENKPLWNNGYDFRFINNKPLKLLSINNYKNDCSSSKLKTIIMIINDTIKLHLEEYEIQNQDTDTKRFLFEQENDPEYLLAYYLCKYSSFDGWITSASYLGFSMLKLDTIKKLKLLSVTEPLNENKILMYYTEKQWKDQFDT